MTVFLRVSTRATSRWGRLLASAVALTLTGTLLVLPSGPARADGVVPPDAGRFTVRGAGWGHGWGMSQYGAYGAARQGLDWRAILAFYYPGTTRRTLPASSSIRVWVTADDDGSLQVRPAAGLSVRDTEGGRFTLPTGTAYASWRIARTGTGFRLSHRTPDGAEVVVPTGLAPTPWSFAGPSPVKVVLPSGSVRSYRGSVGLIRWGSGARTVNQVRLEDYVRGVVPVEMPTSWPADAVRAQSVAARSYGVRIRDFGRAEGYDICDTTACQVYRGLSAETPAGNAAVLATAGVVLTHRGAVALTQFASSNGGHSAQGAYPYLAPRPDPYDGVVRSNAWRRTITAAQVAARFPTVGAVRSIQITARDGAGAWGGRVRTIRIVGSSGSLTVAGKTFQSRFGLRSSLFALDAPVVPPAPPTPPPTVKPGRPYATFPRSFDGGSRADVLLVGPTGELRRHPVVRSALGPGTALGTGFTGYSHSAAVGDWNGDGYGDVVVRTYAGQLLLRRGGPTGRLGVGTVLPGGRGVRMLTGIGDADRDGRPDLALVTAAGNLWITYGDGRLGARRSVRVGTGWSGHDWLRAPGDFDRDGRVDLISKQADRLLLHRGTARGFARPVTLATGWSGYATVTSIGDFTGDGRPDVVARTREGRLVVFGGNGKDRVRRGATLAGSYAGTRFVV